MKPEETNHRSGDAHVPTNLDDFSESGQWLRIGSLMLSILVIGLCWILLLTYFVSRMPAN